MTTLASYRHLIQAILHGSREEVSKVLGSEEAVSRLEQSKGLLAARSLLAAKLEGDKDLPKYPED